MKTFQKILCFIGGSLQVMPVLGQDINFSQFYELPMLRNPALAGIFSGDIRITSAYRNQWESVTVPYRTFGFGAESKRSLGENSDDFITWGVQATDDMAGDSRLSRIQLLPVLNFHKSINGTNPGYLSAGFMGGPVFQRFDPGKLSFDDQFVNGSYSASNPTRQVFTKTNLTFWDLSAGLSFSSMAGEKVYYYLGAGLFHILEPKVAFQQQYDIKLNRKWVVNMGLSLPVSESEQLVVYGDYFMQGGNSQGQGGLMITRDMSQSEDGKPGITGGVFYRWKDAIIPMVKLEINKLGIGFSYDINTSKLRTASQYRGGLELTLSYKTYKNGNGSSGNKNSSNKVKCPFFY